jgi:hypothetical protein
MRGLAGRSVKGRIEGEGLELRKNSDAASQTSARAGRQLPSTFDTLMTRIPQKWIPVLRKNARVTLTSRTLSLSISKQEAGLSSNDGRGSSLLPARSDGFDDVDGGPDPAFYIQMGVVQQVSIRSRF